MKADDFFEMVRQASDSSQKSQNSQNSQSEKEKTVVPPLDMTKANSKNINEDEKKTERAITPGNESKENKKEGNPFYNVKVYILNRQSSKHPPIFNLFKKQKSTSNSP